VPSRRTIALLSGLAGPLLVTLAVLPFRDSVANTNAALLLAVVIVAVAAQGYRLPGVCAALSSGVWFDFLLTRPYQRFSIQDRTDVETTVLLLVVGSRSPSSRSGVTVSRQRSAGSPDTRPGSRMPWPRWATATRPPR
jgi:K+-sensing histidine kinase KdpD